MSEIIKVGAKKAPRVFVASAWKNVSKSGLEYLNLAFDRGLEVTIRDTRDGKDTTYLLEEGFTIQGFANTKREGKKDADIRLSFSLSEKDE